MKSHIYLILVFLIVSSSLKSQISHKVSFTEKELTFEKVLGENKQEYMKVNYSGLSSQGIEGTPELPMKYIKVRVPIMANNISITIEKITKQNIPLSAGIYPAQPDIPMSSLQPMSFVDREPAVYNSDNGFPKEIVSIVGNGYLLGNIHIIDLAVSPVVYYPKENRLELNSEISFRINYSVSEMASKNEGMFIINRKLGKNVDIDLKNLVVNPDFKEPFANTGSSISSRSISSISLPVYEYLVITNEALKPYFNRLISWKRTKGYNAGVVTMEEILADNGITGDPASTYALNDSAGKLRQYLTYADGLGTNYVLLGGIGSIVPFRFGTKDNNSYIYLGDSIGGKVPSDLYFSDISGDWNQDGDDYFGEPTDDVVDYNPELFVGRLLCENASEIDNYTYKLMKYERNPGNGDTAYLHRAFFAQSDQSQDSFYLGQNCSIGEYVAQRLPAFFQNKVIFKEKEGPYSANLPSFPTGDTVIAEMNKGYGLISLFGHGAPGSIVIASKDKNMTPRCLVVPTHNAVLPDSTIQESSNAFSDLTNYTKPSIAYSMSCYNMPYDKVVVHNMNYDYNLGQAFTIAGKFGGPAYIGNTRDGGFSAGRDLFVGFIYKIKYESKYNIGVSEAMSKGAFNNPAKHFTCLAHNLLGCPEIEIWTGNPRIMSGLTASAYYVVVPPSISQPKICVNGLFGGTSYHSSVDSNQYSFSLPSNCKNYTVAVTKHNYIPYIAPLYLQNESVSGTHYVHTNDVHMGSNVTMEKQTGDFVITSSADVTLEPIGEVTLDAGFKVDLGGKFEIKTNQ
jgi:hypothetical protein